MGWVLQQNRGTYYNNPHRIIFVEVDSSLVTFSCFFVVVGLMVVVGYT